MDSTQAWDRLIPIVYGDLRKLAQAYLSKERPGSVLQPTALVHESYLRLSQITSIQWKNRSHFYAVAALLMRRIILDQARRRQTECRILSDAGFQNPASSDLCALDILALNDALDRLAKIDERQGVIVELRFFGGMAIDEIAEILKISSRTVKRDWMVARAWLLSELRPNP